MDDLTGNTVEVTDEGRQQADAQHQEKLEIIKKVLEEQARIREDMKRQQDALFQSLGLSVDDLGGGQVPSNHTDTPNTETSTSSASGTQPPSKKRKRNENDELADANEVVDPLDGNLWDVGGDLSPFDQSIEDDLVTSQDQNGRSDSSLTAQELEELASSRYRDMLSQVKEELGNPLSSTLANAIKRTFGQAVLDKDIKEKLDKPIKIPSNMTIMKTPKLNTEIYIRLKDIPKQKDDGAVNKQKDITRAVVPLLQALDGVSSAKTMMQQETQKRDKATHPVTKHEKDLYKKLGDIDTQLQQCYKLLNYHLTDCVRKRKYSVCSSLGRVFTSFAGLKEPRTDESETKDFLFSEDTMKKMKSDLKKLPVQASKNVRGTGKSTRGHHQGSNYNSHNSYNNQNNNNNNYNNSNHGHHSSGRNQNNYSNRNQNNGNNRNNGWRGRKRR